MGELYERLLGIHPQQSPDPAKKDKISTDGLQACIRLFREGRMTLNQIDTFMANNYGSALGASASGDNAGRQEASDLLAAINLNATTASAADRLTRAERMATLESALVIADVGAAPFNTPAALRAVFGVPDRS